MHGHEGLVPSLMLGLSPGMSVGLDLGESHCLGPSPELGLRLGISLSLGLSTEMGMRLGSSLGLGLGLTRTWDRPETRAGPQPGDAPGAGPGHEPRARPEPGPRVTLVLSRSRRRRRRHRGLSPRRAQSLCFQIGRALQSPVKDQGIRFPLLLQTRRYSSPRHDRHHRTLRGRRYGT